jgi:hypothetical protein
MQRSADRSPGTTTTFLEVCGTCISDSGLVGMLLDLRCKWHRPATRKGRSMTAKPTPSKSQAAEHSRHRLPGRSSSQTSCCLATKSVATATASSSYHYEAAVYLDALCDMAKSLTCRQCWRDVKIQRWHLSLRHYRCQNTSRVKLRRHGYVPFALGLEVKTEDTSTRS